MSAAVGPAVDTSHHGPAGETAENLALMQVIDRQFMETPFYGVRQMSWHLRDEGRAVNPKRVRRLMRLMSLMPIRGPAGYRTAMHERGSEAEHRQAGQGQPTVPRPATRADDRPPEPGPPLGIMLRMTLTGNGCADIPYLPMRRGFLSLVAVMDWYSRRVLSWRLSNTLEAAFCADALEDAIKRFGPPEIMNTDQGSQFTAFAWTDPLRQAGIHISMDGKGRFLPSRDHPADDPDGQRINIFIERLWRSVKYECVYLHAWETGSQARADLRTWFEFYNHRRPHAALDGRPPDIGYRTGTTIMQPNQQTQRVA